ncbi:MAG: hypothetical protein LBO05_07450 [Deltaproteobacteria bacterium]|jgi:hypothetical protein|nr:hypothetical protein [Deltaproteobacteria bacterium]
MTRTLGQAAGGQAAPDEAAPPKRPVDNTPSTEELLREEEELFRKERAVRTRDAGLDPELDFVLPQEAGDPGSPTGEAGDPSAF